MHAFKIGKTTVVKADYLTDALLLTPQPPMSAHAAGEYLNATSHENLRFYGYTISRMREAILGHRPISEHAQPLDRLQSLGYHGVANTLARVVDPSGVEVSDYAGFYSGDPDAMVEYRHEDVEDNVIKIAFNICATAACKDVDFEGRAMGLLSLVNALESQGTAVHIDAFQYATDSPGNVMTWFPVKRAEDPLDILHLYYTMGRKEGLRRIGFALEDYGYARGLVHESWFSGRGTTTRGVPPELTDGYDWVWQSGMFAGEDMQESILSKARQDGLIR